MAPTPIDPRVLELIRWIAVNAEAESRLLTPMPEFFVGAREALSEIARLFEIPEDEMERLVDEAHTEARR